MKQQLLLIHLQAVICASQWLVSLWLIIFLNLCNLCSAQITFQKTFGGSNYDVIYSVQQTIDDGYIAVGRTVSFGAGMNDVYLIKTNANGDTLWTKTYGGGSNDWGNSVQQTTDGGYIIAGHTESFGQLLDNFYLIKINANGDTLWTKVYGDNAWERASSVQQTTDGGYIIIGWAGVTPGGEVYLIKTDGNGNVLWTKTYGGGWSTGDGGSSVQQLTDGGYIIAGHTWSFGAGGWDVYLVKTDSLGQVIWTKTYGGSGEDHGFSVQQTLDSGYIVVGTIEIVANVDNDVYLIKTDVNGDTLWTKTFGGDSIDVGSFVQLTSDGGYIIVGYSNSFGTGSYDIYLIKTDVNGDIIWTKIYGGNNQDMGYSVQQTVDDGFIIVGYTKSFGAGFADAYLIKTDSNGNSGCNQFATNTSMSNILTVVGSGGTTGTWGVVNNTATIVSNTATIDTVLCSSGCPLPSPAFTYKITSDGSSIEVNFVDSTANADTWFWDFGDGFTDTIQSPTHIYADSGIYYVCLTVSNSCGSDTLCEQVNVWCELPAAGFTSTASGLTVSFLDSSINAASWFWDFGDGAQSTQQDTSHTYSSPGDYDVCLTVSNDCGFDTLCKVIDVYETGVNEFPARNGQAGLKFKIYPNPGRGVFVLAIYDPPAGRTGLRFTNGELTIYDMLGCIVSKSKITDRKSEIDISTYSSGIYHLQIITDKEIGNAKLIIE